MFIKISCPRNYTQEINSFHINCLCSIHKNLRFLQSLINCKSSKFPSTLRNSSSKARAQIMLQVFWQSEIQKFKTKQLANLLLAVDFSIRTESSTRYDITKVSFVSIFNFNNSNFSFERLIIPRSLFESSKFQRQIFVNVLTQQKINKLRVCIQTMRRANVV